MLRDNRHDSVHLFGAICPARGVGAAIIMPGVNIEAMNEHLKEISMQVAHSGDLERSIRSIMNTDSGDHEHPLALA
jgi:hypothetical protein